MRRPDPTTCSWLLAAALGGGLAARWLTPPPVQAQAADSGPRYVAVSTEYQQGVGLLFVLDQKTEHLAVYEAHGGAPNSRELVLVGARNISLDTQLDGFNDESEYSFKELKELFERRNLPIGPAGAGDGEAGEPQDG